LYLKKKQLAESQNRKISRRSSTRCSCRWHWSRSTGSPRRESWWPAWPASWT